jgi:hypothetical protein
VFASLVSWVIGIAARPRGIHGLPIDLSKRGVIGKPLDQIRICDVGTPERHQIGQTFRDKAIAAVTVHLHVRDQRAFVERTKMLKPELCRD